MVLGRLRWSAGIVALVSLVPATTVVAVVATATSAAAGVTITVNTTTLPGATDGQCSLDEAIATANTGSPANGCTTGTASAPDTIVFSVTTPHTFQPSELIVTDALTISGPNAGTHTDIVLDGGMGHRLISATNTTALVLNDLTLQQGAASGTGGHGGAINGGSSITTTDVLFNQNSAGDSGGAIETNGTVSVTNSTFTNNGVTLSTGGAIDGGAGTITVANTDFSGNQANTTGGAINNGGTVTITGDSDFTNNVSGASGAAVLSNGAVTVNGTSDFTNNDAPFNSGGGIKANTVTISGGADFTNNDAGGGGGCIKADATITVNAGGDGSTFTNNTTVSGQPGGCLSAATGVDVTGATFTKNVAGQGGAIYNSSGTATVSNSFFGGPTVADGNTADAGGAISTSGILSITGSTFRHNSAGNNGGGAAFANGTSTITSSTFDQNSTSGTGSGGAFLAGDTVTIGGSTFSANAAGADGGALEILTGGTITNSTFRGNSASGGHGTALGFGGGNSLTLTNVTVADSSGAGGAVQRQSAGAVAMQSTIVANTTGGGTNCVGTFDASSGFNLESVTGNSGSTCPSGGTNLADADPHLGALAVNVPGTTATMLPDLLLSPAVEAVTSGCPPPATDQRGVNRPQGLACDIGAVELEDGLFSALVPARILDTRGSTGGHPGAVGPGQPFNLHVLGHDGVPATGVSAVVMNLTAVGPTAGGWVTAYPTGVAEPLAASVNFDPGQTIGNLVTVKVGTGGDVRLSNANGFVHLVADIVGYYGLPGDSRLTPLVPGRILDTRGATGGHPGALGPGGTFDLQVTGQGGVPASGVTGVVANVTAVGPTAGGWLTAWPTGVTQPLAASVNFDPGENIGNLVKLKLGTGGKVSLFNANGFVHVVVDVVGWYGPAGDSRVAPVEPARILDTRGPTGGHPSALGPGQQFDLVVQGQGGVPVSGATAVVVNITAVSPSAAGFVTAWPTGATMPLASTINFAAGQTIGHLAVLKLGTGGKVSLFNANGFAHLVVDVVGWYGSP